MRQGLVILAVILGVVAYLARDRILPLNTKAPAYIKQVTALQEGSGGTAIYIVLADSGGEMTTADGLVTLDIAETEHEYTARGGLQRQERLLYTRQMNVKASDFQRAKVGLGAFQHEVILLSFGRIPHSSFRRVPSAISGVVRVRFMSPGLPAITGEGDVIF